MQKVIGINLNGRVYHVEEGGYDALRAYLDRAAERLKDNPDRDEIVADLEQAVAEKCGRYLGPHKTAVTVREIEQILGEMGPVHDPAEDAASRPGARDDTAGAGATAGEAPKRLYQIQEGAMISGVCNGLAAYLKIDVTIVRVVFVVLAVLTKGIWVLVYIAMALMIPVAATAEERAAAHGLPFNAQELIDRTKKNYRRQSRHWRAQWRRARRESTGAGADVTQNAQYLTQVMTGVLSPLTAVAQAAAFLLLVVAIISFVNHNVVFGWAVPKDIPLWAGVLMLVVVYQAIVSPLQAARYAMVYAPRGPVARGPEALSGMVSLAATIFGFWLAYEYVPEVREFVHALPTIAREVWETVERR